MGVRLPGRQGEDVAHSASSRALVVGQFVPHYLRCDGAAAADELGSTTGQHVGAGGREVDVIAGSSVGRAVVARSDGYRDAEGGSGLASGVECGHGLRSPAGFRPTPADRNHARLVGCVVDRAADGIDETLVGIRRKVDNDLCPRSDGSRDFDIEHDLAVRAVCVAGRVLALVDGDSSYLGRLLAQSFEVRSKVRGAIAATQLDDADGLAGGSRTLGKLVKLAHLNGRVRGAGCGWHGRGRSLLFRPGRR